MYEAWLYLDGHTIMKYRPIIFKDWGVRAIMDDSKGMSRRLRGLEKINDCPDEWEIQSTWRPRGEVLFRHESGKVLVLRCPYGQSGDRLWIKETFWQWGKWVKNGWTKTGRQRWCFKAVYEDLKEYRHVYYAADGDVPTECSNPSRGIIGHHKRPSIFMPRKHSRLTLEITEVLPPQRVQEISEADIKAEGVRRCLKMSSFSGLHYLDITPYGKAPCSYGPWIEAWDKINKKRGHGWDVNPWVWPFRFKRVT